MLCYPIQRCRRGTHLYSTQGVSLGIDDRALPHLVFISGYLYLGFERACVIRADMSQLVQTLILQRGPGGTFLRAAFDLGITFGGTELKAFVQWEENVCALRIAPSPRVFLLRPSNTDYVITDRASRNEAPQRLYPMRCFDLISPLYIFLEGVAANTSIDCISKYSYDEIQN